MAGQLPDVVQQLLMWHMALGAVKAVAAVIFAVLLVLVDFWLFTHTRRIAKEEDSLEISVLGWGLMGCFARVPAWAFLVLGMWNLTWLQIWIAPKIFLIEYAARMVTK